MESARVAMGEKSQAPRKFRKHTIDKIPVQTDLLLSCFCVFYHHKIILSQKSVTYTKVFY